MSNSLRPDGLRDIQKQTGSEQELYQCNGEKGGRVI
jgi:hypothetical protein